MNWSLIFMLFFLVYTFLIIFSARSGFYDTYGMDDFFVAGRSLNSFFSTATFVATWFSAASILGLGGSLYVYGISTIIYSILPWFFGAIFLFLLASPFKKYKIYTYAEFFYVKYDSKMLQTWVALLMIFSYILYITMQIKGFGLVMSMLLDIPYTFAILLVYLYILYTTFGGLFSVVKTDAVNAIIIFVAFIIFGIYIILKCGGFLNIISAAGSIDTHPVSGWDIKTPAGGLLHPFCKGLQPPAYLFTSFFGWGLGLAANPQYVIRIVSAKDKDTSRKMILYSLILLSTIYFFIVFGSIGLRTLVPTAPTLKNIDEIILYLFNSIAHPYLTGLVLIAIIASSVSTANSELLLIANSFTYDILKDRIKREIGEDEILLMNRLTIAAAGTLSLLLSYNPPKNLIEFGGNMWGFFASSTFIPLYAGIFLKAPSKYSAELSFVSGLSTYLILLCAQSIISDPLYKVIHPGFPAFIVSAAAFLFGEWRVKNAKH